MRKNTLIVSVLIGLGSLAALYSVNNDQIQQQFEPRNQEQIDGRAKFNSEYSDLMRSNAVTGKIEASDYAKVVQEARAKRGSRASLGLNWEFTGPDNIGGLTRAIIIDNADSDRLIAGGDGGGIFLSTNGAGSWEFKSENWVNINISSIAQDPDGRIYVTTGIGGYNGTRVAGGGMYVSDDRGETWSIISSTIPNPSVGNDPWYYPTRIAIAHEKNAAGNYAIYVATDNGLLVSSDKGLTWIKPLTIPNCAAPLPGKVNDVVISKSGRVLVAYNGQLYISDAGETVCSYTLINNGISGSIRMSLAVCPNDADIVYAYRGLSGNNFEVLKSTDGGDSWGLMQPAPPTVALDSTFDLLGYNQVDYNQAIAVDPNDCDNIYVGAVELYRVSGAWTSVAIRNRFASNFYVHADKHWFMYDQKNPNTMYVGSDGGVGKTNNAAAGLVNWTENNRHYATTQYYGVATSPKGQVVGGAQDNGNHSIDPNQPGISGKDGRYLWTLGDGFDCDVSSIGNVAFVTSQFGNVGRDSYENDPSSPPAIQVHMGGNPGTGGVAPFKTVIRLWESKNDLTSQDSIVFLNDTISVSAGAGDGNKQFFQGVLEVEFQPAAKIVPGLVSFVDLAGGQTVDDSDEFGVLKSFGDSVGTIDYSTGAYTIRWFFPPPLGSSLSGLFHAKYNAGDTVNLNSKNWRYPFIYVLGAPLTTGDSVIVQDPIQSMLAVSVNGGVRVTRGSLYIESAPSWIEINSITPSCIEYSKDGNHMYVGSNAGQVIRISGLNNLYEDADPNLVLTINSIFSASGNPVSGICIHPTDPGKLLVTVGRYGTHTHIAELTNAQNATSAAAAGRRNLQGDLPEFPVYDPEYNVYNPSQVLLGTELGVWATSDISNNNPSWTQEVSGLENVRVYDVLQQRLPFNEASNYGQFYLATYGRGLWTTTDLVGIDDDFGSFDNDVELDDINLYPNPVSVNGNVSFNMPVTGKVEIVIYSITGKLISRTVESFTKGDAKHEFSVTSMPGGTYFMSVTVGNSTKTAKFVVLK